MNKRILLAVLLLLSFILTNVVQGQQVSTTTGGKISGSGGSVTYSIGQTVYTTYTNSSGSVAQGVQQPYEISIASELNEIEAKIQLLVYPNPTNGLLILTLDKAYTDAVYELYDVNGKLIQSKQVTELNTNILMNEYAVATYFLKIKLDTKLVKMFKILKN